MTDETNIPQEEITMPHVETEAVPNAAGQAASAEVLAEIRSRSFSGRHPELGKMVKDPITGRRVRQAEQSTEQVFAKRWKVVDGEKVYTDEKLIAGLTPETETVIAANKARAFFGAAAFARKRKNPPKNWRQNLLVELVRFLIPDEYTPEQLEQSKRTARRVLAKRYGRHGFLPPVWMGHKQNRLKPKEENATETN